MSVVVLRILNANENWKGTVTASAEEAMEAVRHNHFDVVLLGSGLDENTESNLKTDLLQLDPNLKIILHYGGGSGLLKAEIETALGDGHKG